MKRLRPAIVALTCALAAACGSRDGADTGAALPEGVLAAVDGTELTRAMLDQATPKGLAPDDSTRFARAYIRNWIDTRLVEDVAARAVDMDEIDRLVEQYRRDAIMRAYRDRAFDAEQAGTTFSDSLVADYYDRHSSELRLQRPLIKGVYIKLPDDARELPAVRRLYRSTRPADIDRLEKEVLGSAIHYDYFRDRWIDWEQVEARIPYDFGANPADYVAAHRNLDVSLGGFTYLLEISDVLPAGSVMPLATARPLIEERLTAEKRRAFDAALRTRMVDRALARGTLRLNCDL